MEAKIEYRIAEQHARAVFRTGEGRAISESVRVVRLDAQDPRVNALAQLYSKNKGRGFYNWRIDRRFSEAEYREARVHLLQIRAGFLPTGEECGTVYDDREMCPLCGAGRIQASPLRLRLTNAPKRSEIAQTWGGEIVVSARIVRLLIEAETTGWGIGPVQRPTRGDEEPFSLSETESGKQLLKAAAHSGVSYPSPEFYVWLNGRLQRPVFREAIREHESWKGARRRMAGGTSADWYQFVPTAKIELSTSTRFGFNPFDDDREGRNRCPLGLRNHVSGLNLISQSKIAAESWEGRDFARSREYAGVRRGLFNPRPLVFMSGRVRNLLIENGIKGWTSEIAQLL